MSVPKLSVLLDDQASESKSEDWFLLASYGKVVVYLVPERRCLFVGVLNPFQLIQMNHYSQIRQSSLCCIGYECVLVDFISCGILESRVHLTVDISHKFGQRWNNFVLSQPSLDNTSKEILLSLEDICNLGVEFIDGLPVVSPVWGEMGGVELLILCINHFLQIILGLNQ